MGNDRNFVLAQALPSRFFDTPMGLALPAPYLRNNKRHRYKKRHSSLKTPQYAQGYDAPPSLVPPPIMPIKYDDPLRNASTKSDLYQLNSKNYSMEINNHHRKIHKSKLLCCTIS